MRQLRAGAEAGCLEGAIDVHVHADPCSLIARNQDFIEVAGNYNRFDVLSLQLNRAPLAAIREAMPLLTTLRSGLAARSKSLSMSEGTPCDSI